MLQTLAKNWWLLALAGLLDAALALFHLLMQGPNGATVLGRYMFAQPISLLGETALACGVCTVAAATWHSRNGRPWLLALNGAALAGFGLLCLFWSRGRHGFLPVALLFLVMALSLGILAFAAARSVRHGAADEWLLKAAGTISVVYALAFLVSGLGWLRFPSGSYWLFMSSWFAFNAVSMMGFGLRAHRLRTAAPAA